MPAGARIRSKAVTLLRSLRLRLIRDSINKCISKRTKFFVKSSSGDSSRTKDHISSLEKKAGYILVGVLKVPYIVIQEEIDDSNLIKNRELYTVNPRQFDKINGSEKTAVVEDSYHGIKMTTDGLAKTNQFNKQVSYLRDETRSKDFKETNGKTLHDVDKDNHDLEDLGNKQPCDTKEITSNPLQETKAQVSRPIDNERSDDLETNNVEVKHDNTNKSDTIDNASDDLKTTNVEVKHDTNKRHEEICMSIVKRNDKLSIVESSQENVKDWVSKVKHDIFLSHSGSNKKFVHQLNEELKKNGCVHCFFDQDPYALPKGEEFSGLIKNAAQTCNVAVIVLSEEFLSSRWPMIELFEIYTSQQNNNPTLRILPLFYKLSVKEIDEKNINDRWMPKWKKHDVDDEINQIKANAVKCMRKINGEEIGEKSEAQYIKDVTKSILRISHSAALNNSIHNVIGYERLCKELSSKFKCKDPRTEPKILGLYGIIGGGKTKICEALHDYYHAEYYGRVCHLRLPDCSNEQKKKILKTLLEFENTAFDTIDTEEKKMTHIKGQMKSRPVFLIIDNITDATDELKILEYLSVEFHPESRILLTSRNKDVIQNLRPNLEFCEPIPKLTNEEAKEIFRKNIFLTKSPSYDEVQEDIIQLCVNNCRFEFNESGSNDKGGNYHPHALKTLGSFLFKKHGNNLSDWKTYIENELHTMKVWEYTDIFEKFGSEFSTFEDVVQQVFLDIALYWNYDYELHYSHIKDWLLKLGDVNPVNEEKVNTILRKLCRYSVILWNGSNTGEIIVPEIYKDFAKWYVGESKENNDKRNYYFDLHTTSLKKIPTNLHRARICQPQIGNKLQNIYKMSSCIKLLHLEGCKDLTSFDLQGFDSLCHLKLTHLQNLKEIKISNTSKRKNNTYCSLQYVFLYNLDSLTSAPELKLCTPLYCVEIWKCCNITNFDGLRDLEVEKLGLCLYPEQFKMLPNFKLFSSLKQLFIGSTKRTNLIQGSTHDGNTEEIVNHIMKTFDDGGLEDLKFLGIYNIRVRPEELERLENFVRIEHVETDKKSFDFLPYPQKLLQ